MLINDRLSQVIGNVGNTLEKKAFETQSHGQSLRAFCKTAIFLTTKKLIKVIKVPN